MTRHPTTPEEDRQRVARRVQKHQKDLALAIHEDFRLCAHLRGADAAGGSTRSGHEPSCLPLGKIDILRHKPGHVLHGLNREQAERVFGCAMELIEESMEAANLQDAIARHEQSCVDLERLGGPTCTGLR